MAITIPGEHCLLCGRPLVADDIPVHLRTVHQVVPGETTIADVPAGRAASVQMTSASVQHEPVLVGAL